jgi:iron(II)-dependent oxidoreductase
MSFVALEEWVCDARERTRALTADLTPEQLLGPRLPHVNPLLWEAGHVAWFQEKWVLRHAAGRRPIRADADALYDSAAVPHDTRWGLSLPGPEETLRYLGEVRDRVLERLRGREPTRCDRYFILLSVFHEDMHAEAFAGTRQSLGYPAPAGPTSWEGEGAGPLSGDAEVPGGTFRLGAAPEEPFVFDNEKWAHPVELRPFRVARAPVTQAEFTAFVEDGGYRRQQFWGPEGWRWREEAGAGHPIYWRREPGGRWLRRDFDRWVGLEPYQPVVNVNWYEAEAYCRWSGRRLPAEAEWEAAACGPGPKRRFPWGEAPPAGRANLDGRAGGCLDVGALAESDGAFGCRQMIGNVWEWTAADFLPYPGFVADPYKEYSAPWFGTHKVLRGGCWATRGRLLRNTWRNFYRPERRDVWAGFRTCAVRP